MITPKETATSKFSADVTVGVMVEGPYGWNEFCDEHARSILAVYPDRNNRTVSLFEVTNSWRPYKCHACSKSLWQMPEVRRADSPATTLKELTA
jgi:hypothetical protein